MDFLCRATSKPVLSVLVGTHDDTVHMTLIRDALDFAGWIAINYDQVRRYAGRQYRLCETLQLARMGLLHFELHVRRVVAAIVSLAFDDMEDGEVCMGLGGGACCLA